MGTSLFKPTDSKAPIDLLELHNQENVAIPTFEQASP
jgi:hypothetical protein